MSRALFLHDDGDGVRADIDEVDESRLPDGDVLVSVLFSSINYKDALAVTGRGKIIRGEYPFVAGIDLVGRVESSDSGDFTTGDLVVATGWGLGEMRWGGYSQIQRLRSEWLVRLPEDLSPQESMIIGTAGFTAMLSVMALEDLGIEPTRGEVVVTGASGGVGSFAIALLAAAGYDTVASTGSEAGDYLRRLGATRIIERGDLGSGARRPMDSARWAGAVDTVGGKTLEAIISQLERHGSVAACGLAGGHELNTTVFPFILRGVNLLGIDSNTCPPDRRRRAWDRMATTLADDILQTIKTDVVSLGDIPSKSEELLDGRIRGRLVVDLQG